MAKLDWSKAPLRDADPARAQRVRDFVEPDRVIISVTELTKQEKKQLAAKLAHRKARRQQAIPKAKRKPEQGKLVGAKPDRAERETRAEERRVAGATKAIAKAEHQRRYLAKAAQRQADMEAKKKSHLDAWVEGQDGLQADRENLHRSWRSTLLRDKQNK